MIEPKRIMAIDFGERRMGIALSDEGQILASPRETIDRRETPEIFPIIKSYVEDEGVFKVIVGLPLNADGSLTKKAEEIEVFIKELSIEIPNIIIDTIDESYSSVRALDVINLQKPSRRGSKDKIDRIAAAIFLQDYLDEI